MKNKKEIKQPQVDTKVDDKKITKEVSSNVNKTIEEKIADNKDIRSGNPSPKQKLCLLISTLVSIASLVVFLFVPFNSSISPLDFFRISGSKISGNQVLSLIIFISLLITFIVDLYLLINCFVHYKHNNKSLISKLDNIIKLNFVVSIIYGLMGIGYFIADVFSKQNNGFCFSIIYTIIQTLILIFNSVIKSYFMKDYIFIDKSKNEDLGKIKSFRRPYPSIELLAYTILFSLLPIPTLFIDLFKVYSNGTLIQPAIKGIDFFTKLNSFTNSGYKLVAFFFYLFVLIDGALLLLAVVLFILKRKRFYPICAASMVINFVFICFIALYGLYYKIVLASNTEKIAVLLKQFYPSIPESIITSLKNTTVETYSYFAAVGAIAFFIYILCRNPSRMQLAYEQLDSQEIMDKRYNAPEVCEESINDLINDYDLLGLKKPNGGGNNISSDNPVDVNLVDKEKQLGHLKPFDACPAFTELDGKVEIFKEALANREKYTFANCSLPSLIEFIVNYAKNSRLHLSYSKDDIAAFVAGLGATRLTILQGMSGTGKTSLPKIFMEAIYGNCELIEIESSWREKNELLGFYNEFSKMYTPKKFTQCLYKAALNPDVITFIVLDEMNLSRIEYYFSDFLSLMENEEDNRKIKLSNIKLYNIKNDKYNSYLKLEEDHTLKVPTNVWFIGTANRDESTFEISDKVYDRAHTMNFNKRAPSIVEFDKPMSPKFLKYDQFSKLLENAKSSYKFNIEKNEVIKRVEQLLSPFNISFGNRIYKQITDFVRIYCSCFTNPGAHEFDAVETILLTKVVMKLENKNIDNRDLLIGEFKKLKLNRCVDFISKLSEDF